MNNVNIFFTVVIPLYNKEKYIKRTIDSVIRQTFDNFEIVIIDDGSSDRSYEIVESIKDHRIRLIRQENSGPSKARNRGIREAKGKLIAFLDADDEWLPEKLEKHYELHSEYPEIIWSCSAYKVVKGMNEKIVLYHEEGVLSDAIDAITDGLMISTISIVIKKDIFINDRYLFNEAYSRSEDRELWHKLACKYPNIGYIGKVLAIYQQGIDEKSLTKTAFSSMDYSFLTIAERIEEETNKLDVSRRERLLNYLTCFNKKAILNIWARTDTYNKDSHIFKKYIDNEFVDSLDRWFFLPKIIKKIFIIFWVFVNSNKKSC